jgi:uncharacterized damage-inducible protein DinB
VATHQKQLNSPLAQSLVQIFSANERLNQLLIEHLPPAAWLAKPPGKVRTIAAIFTHIHNMRIKWVRLSAPHLKLPAQLSRYSCTPQQAGAALAQSAKSCTALLTEALGSNTSSVKKFQRDGWAQPWPVRVEMLCYMLAHEAHHRGQICMLAVQMGTPLPKKIAYGIWNWEKLWKEIGAKLGPIQHD